ncbi:MAG TPA: hypothetical protein VN920_16560 [Pyrinomonadaceae bacterium]|nr:hypothetical protein [Pyrinomonadaceae bacterium]
MHHAKLIRYGIASLLFVATFASGSLLAVNAQEKAKSTTVTKKPVKGPGGDPFVPFQPPRVVIRRSNLVSPPSIQQRIEQYRAQKLASMNAHLAAPKPTTALLLGEIQVVGITRTPRGYAAIVEAIPIKLSYVVYPGERFYDGQLVAIEDSRLVFRHETVFTDGKRELSVETKALRQQSAVDAMTATKAAPASATPVADEKNEKKPEQKPSATDKP